MKKLLSVLLLSLTSIVVKAQDIFLTNGGTCDIKVQILAHDNTFTACGSLISDNIYTVIPPNPNTVTLYWNTIPFNSGYYVSTKPVVDGFIVELDPGGTCAQTFIVGPACVGGTNPIDINCAACNGSGPHTHFFKGGSGPYILTASN